VNRPAWTRDPAAPSLALFGALAASGFVAIALGWRAAARELFVPFQIPAIVSGALGGMALLVIGAGFFNIQAGRRLNAGEKLETEALLEEAHALVAAFKERAR
jgi:hypothetical protein